MNELTEKQTQDIADQFMRQIDSHHGSTTAITRADAEDFARAIIAQDRAQRQAGQEPVPEDYRLISVGQLLAWKSQANETAARSLKAERYEAGIKLKQWIADAINAAPQPTPEGFKLVPLEPTEEMVQAGCLSQQRALEFDNYDDWFNSHSGGISERIRNYLRKDYAAMLSAAPLPLKEQPNDK